MKGEHEADKYFKMDYIRELEITLYAESLQSIQHLQNEIASLRRAPVLRASCANNCGF